MPKQYQTILLEYIKGGGEPDLELAYEYGRSAITHGMSVLQLIDAHYEALTDVLRKSPAEDTLIIVQRAANLLKEALSPFEMTHRGYSDTIQVLRNQNEKLTKLMEERSQLLQQREDFMMVVTHDLKTPINAADRCLALMLEGSFGPLSPEQTEVISVMKDSNQRMFTMVKNLLEAYRYDQSSPMLSLGRVEIRSLIDSLMKSFALSAQMRGLSMDVVLPENPICVDADGVAILHVLTNLVDNAIKFTPKGGKITVYARTEDSSVILEVRDTGKGISAEDQPRLFHRFFQSETGRKQYTGTGLGLYLCQQIVTAHGGDIHCESELQKGTTFVIRLRSFTENGVATNPEAGSK